MTDAPYHLDPIDKDGTAFRVKHRGRQIGLVTLNRTAGILVWQWRRRDEHRPEGAFNTAEHAAEQLVANHVTRRWDAKQKQQQRGAR